MTGRETKPNGGPGLVAAVILPLGSEALSLISLPPASRRERRIYEDA
jgi:hypothetical protein